MKYFKAYQEILQNKQISRTQQLIMSILLNRAEYHNFNSFYCYEQWIANELQCSLSTVKRGIKKLEEVGLVIIERTYNHQQRKTINYYTMNFNITGNTVVASTEEIVSGVDENTHNVDWDNIDGDTIEETPEERDMDAELEQYLNSPQFHEVLKKEEQLISQENEEYLPEPIEIIEDNDIDDSDLLREWKSECDKHITNCLSKMIEGVDAEICKKICNRRLQPIYDKCVAAGIDEIRLQNIKKNYNTQIKQNLEREYNKKLMSA